MRQAPKEPCAEEQKVSRREWDSNPRNRLTRLNSFQDCRLRPLGHPSTVQIKTTSAKETPKTSAPWLEAPPPRLRFAQAVLPKEDIGSDIVRGRWGWGPIGKAMRQAPKEPCARRTMIRSVVQHVAPQRTETDSASERRRHGPRARTVMSQRRSRVGRRTKGWRRGWDSNPRNRSRGSQHFECCALGRTMRPLLVAMVIRYDFGVC